MDWQSLIWQVWREANTPSSYPRDPYGALLNQIAHVAVGAFLAAVICVGWCAAVGEMPIRGIVGIGVVLGYLLVIEMREQGWQGRDTISDTLFVTLGVVVPLVSLEEVAAGHRILLELHVRPALLSLVAVVVALAIHVIPRALRR